MTTSGPLPTTITFLNDLPFHPQGAKVRFLGCVTNYVLSTGTLELQHAYPLSTTTTFALVDVNLLLEGLKRDDTLVGAWVNVIGYVDGFVREARTGRMKAKDEDIGEGIRRGHGGGKVLSVRVQAVMLWGAGALRTGGYESALEARLKMDKSGT